MIAHLPLASHPNPRRVLIIGGGDGGVVREVLKYKIVESVVLVDIDEVCVVDIPLWVACLPLPSISFNQIDETI